MKVAVLGCGPAGLLAAHTAESKGAEVTIFSQPSKSPIHGAQFIHEPIPGLTHDTPDDYVRFIKHGTRAGYAEKVYGKSDAPCSWDHFEDGFVPAWQTEKVYDVLWERFAGSIVPLRVDPGDIPIWLDDYDRVFSTIPKPQLCIRGHEFTWKNVWIADYCSLPYDVRNNVILYNGDPLDHWYRASRLFGHDATESTDPMSGAVPGMKPLSNNCDCWPELVNVGRFGKWEKGILVHHAYGQVTEALDAVQPL